MPDFLLSLHKYVSEMILNRQLATINKNTTNRTILTPKDVMDVHRKHQIEHVPIMARICKLEEDMVNVNTKLDKIMNIINITDNQD